MTKSDYQAERDRLRRGFRGADNPGSFNCQGCERCSSCMFCVGCSECHRCTHCTDSSACTNCSHCTASVACHGCTHCDHAEGCHDSAYLTDCLACTACTYCTGCVGLVNKEFHFLNVPYARKDYFALVASLVR